MSRARRCWQIVLILLALSAPLTAADPWRAVNRSAPAGSQPVALVEHGAAISRRELAHGAEVLTYQVDHQMRRFWNVPAIDVRPFRGHRPPAGWPVIELVRSPAPPRTRGYHTTDPGGRPLAVVFLRKWRSDWTVGASHELLEMLVDPQGESVSFEYLEEVCDPVQFLWYKLRGVYVSDFVTPSWYADAAGPWDIGGRLRAADSF